MIAWMNVTRLIKIRHSYNCMRLFYSIWFVLSFFALEYDGFIVRHRFMQHSNSVSKKKSTSMNKDGNGQQTDA